MTTDLDEACFEAEQIWNERPTQTDRELIEEYLHLPNWMELAASFPPTEDATELLNRPQKAKEALVMKRFELARELTNAGLYALLVKILGVPEPVDWIIEPGLPVSLEAHPAYIEWHLRIDNGTQIEKKEEEEQRASLIAKAKQILGDRWQEGPVDARAWMAFVIEETNEPKYAPAILRAWSAYCGTGIFIAGQNRRHSSDDASPRMLENATQKIEAEKFISEIFTGAKAPEWLQLLLDENFAREWPEGELLETEHQKAHLAIEWQSFWQNYRGLFLSQQAAEAKKAKKIKKVRIAAGKASGRARQRKKWLQFCQQFADFARDGQRTPSLIDEFPKQKGVEESKGREFLKTLLTANNNRSAHRALSKTLIRLGIELNQETADQCLRIIFGGNSR